MRFRIMFFILTLLFIQSTSVIKAFTETEDNFSLEDFLGILEDPEQLDLFEKGLLDISDVSYSQKEKAKEQEEDFSGFSAEELFLKNFVSSGKGTVPIKQYESYLQIMWKLSGYLAKVETILETSKKVSSKLYLKYGNIKNDINTIKLLEESEPYVRVFLSQKVESLRKKMITLLNLLRHFSFAEYVGIEEVEEDEEMVAVEMLALKGTFDQKTEKLKMDTDFNQILNNIPEISKELTKLKENPEIKKLTEQQNSPGY